MFINNLTGKTIKDISFDGFWFSIPAGVSLCWDNFGEHLFKNAYPEQGSGVPPVIRATAAQWDGKHFVDVRRFELNSALVPNRADLIKLAKKRGVDAATIENWREDETIDGKVMAEAINQLDVPEHIKYPSAGEVPAADTSVEDAEKEALKAADAAKEREAQQAAAAKAGAASTAPTTAGKPKAAAKKTTVARSVPKTAAPKPATAAAPQETSTPATK